MRDLRSDYYSSGSWKDNDIAEYIKRYADLFKRQMEFYNQHRIQRHCYNQKRAVRGEWNVFIDEFLKTIGLENHRKITKKEADKILIGIGSAEFATSNGTFTRYFVDVLKGKGLGDSLYAVNEYYTSQKCPRCGYQTEELKDTGKKIKRIKECKKCEKHYHRDEMAGHNICNILYRYSVEGKWPVYLENKRYKYLEEESAVVCNCNGLM